MSSFGGSATAEIAAPRARCFQTVCDTPGTPDWHQSLVAVEILDRDADGRSSLIRTTIDAIVTEVTLDLRLTYDEQRVLHMQRESGDLKQMTATWTFVDLGEGRTEASFVIEFDPGRVLSLLGKGPVAGKLEALLAKQPPEGLKRAVEDSSAGQ